MKKIVFQTGRPFHPVEAQANLIQSWLPSDWKIKPAFGTEAFEQLANADLYIDRIRSRTTDLGKRADPSSCASDDHRKFRRPALFRPEFGISMHLCVHSSLDLHIVIKRQDRAGSLGF
jgi:hypothetical protein